MGWKNKDCRSIAIKASGKPIKTNDLDMAARRILEGLGLSFSTFPKFEQAEFDTNYTDECMWSRVQRFFYQHCANNPSSYAYWTTLVFCQPSELPSKLKVTFDTVELPTSNQVFVYREGEECYCELLLVQSELGHLFLQPPYLAMKWLAPGILIIKMKAKDFAKQYELRTDDEHK